MNLVTSAKSIIEACKDADVIIVDTETSSLRPWIDGKVLAGVGVKPLRGEMFYLPVRHKDSVNASIYEVQKLFEALRGKTLVFHNAKFDMAVLWQDGIDLRGWRIVDTVVTMRLVSEDEPNYELKGLADTYFPFASGEPRARDVEKQLKDYIRSHECYTLDEKGEKQFRYDWVPAAYIADPYVRNDLRFTEFFYGGSMKRIAEYKLEELLELEIELTQALFDMEGYGFLVDLPYIRTEMDTITNLRDKLKQQCYDTAYKELSKRAKKNETVQEILEFLEHGGQKKKVYKRTGEVKWLGDYDLFNATNPHFIKKIFPAMGLRSKRKTPGGEDSWDKLALAEIDHPFAELVVRTRACVGMLKFYDQFLANMDGNCVIHPSIFQAGAKTGRCSCREPNLQNLPTGGSIGNRLGAQVDIKKLQNKMRRNIDEDNERKEKRARYEAIGRKQIAFDEEIEEEILDAFESELLKRVRGAFIARPGHFLMSIDWQNVEMRIFSDYANEKEIQETFRLGLDIHRLTARAAFGLLPDENENPDLFKWVRTMGKQIAFGLLYGMGVTLLAAEIGKSKEEAKEFMKNFFSRFKNAKTFIKQVTAVVVERGYLKNRWGRRRNLEENEAYKGINYLIQGTAADLMKDAIVRVWKLLKKYKTRLILTVHDELVFDVLEEEARIIIPLIVKEMETCDRLRCDLKCDVEVGTRWSELTKLSCKTCEGKGVEVDIDKPTLIEALFQNDTEQLKKVNVKKCNNCDGHGYDLDLLEKVA